jgi:glutathione S-transferase
VKPASRWTWKRSTSRPARIETESGVDYAQISPKGYVPALELEVGSLLTEGPAIVQFLADQAPDSRLAPPAGAIERYRLQEWLSFVSSELHKMFSPWLFHPEYGTQAQEVARDKIRSASPTSTGTSPTRRSSWASDSPSPTPTASPS